IEHSFGPVVVITPRLGSVDAIAKLGFVQAVRLPRPATASVPNATADASTVGDLGPWSLERLDKRKGKAQTVQVAVISDDCSDWERHVGKALPQATTLLDLTAERSPTLLPEPSPGDGVGDGTAQALAVARVAPRAELVLVRVGRSA